MSIRRRHSIVADRPPSGPGPYHPGARRSLRLLPAAVLATAAGCGEGVPTGLPESAVCTTEASIQTCISKPEFRPGQTAVLTVVNRRSASILLDMCSIEMTRGETRGDDYTRAFDPSNRCGRDASLADVIENMRTLDPRDRFQLALPVGTHLSQGFYSVNVFRVNDDGTPTEDSPFLSPVFLVIPTAGR